MELALQSLNYPLNIYAALVFRVCGQVPYLGYGLAQSEDPREQANSLLQAQRRMADLLVRNIFVPAPANVLDLGCGFGTLALQLRDQGYQITGIDHNPHLIQFAQRSDSHSENPGSWIAASMTDLPAILQQAGDKTRYDVIILQNSARYESLLLGLGIATSLLAPGGQLLVVEEFVSSPAEARQQVELPVLRHALALAERSGLVLETDEDLSGATSRFIEILLWQFDQHVVALAELAKIDLAVLTELRNALARDLESLRSGHHTHRLLSWRLPSPDSNAKAQRRARYQAPAISVLPASMLEADRYRRLFEDSFDVEFDPRLWEWKYDGGRSASVVALRGDQAVAHYGGIRRRIDYFGVTEQAVQICDVMVKPEERSFFSRDGLFFKTAAAMLEQHVGYQGAHLLGFGFPNLKAMHVASRLGLYGTTGEVLIVHISPGAKTEPGWQVESQPLTALSYSLLGQWWTALREGMKDSILAHRDPDYLYYRYAMRPGIQYDCRVVQLGGTASALGVVRDHGDYDLLMDIICAPEHLPAAWRALSVDGEKRGRHLRFWVTDGQLHRLEGESPDDLQVEHMDVYVPCNIWTEGPSPAELAGAWWLTAGDTDFL